MKVTYLNHSGFLLEWEACYWLFDYYKGTIPRLNPEKEILVFCSHSHGDHFNPAVFALAMEYPSVTYLFSNQIKSAYRKFQRDPRGIRISAAKYACICGMDAEADEKRITVPLPQVQFLQSRTDTFRKDSFGNELHIHTLQSTDCGCAFVLQYQGKTVYHAGDLHWWYWTGEPEDWNRKMTADFKKEVEYLEGRTIDLAFTPLDSRQGVDYALGMNYLREKTEMRHVFPMHFWDDFSVIPKYLQEYPIQEKLMVYPIKEDGQNWEIVL